MDTLIEAKVVKELRERTGAGFMNCKKALTATNGDMDAAVEWLQKKAFAPASGLEHRIASEGMVGTYIHPGSRVGVLLEVNCETDFAARSADFQAFAKDICMHIAASNPVCVSVENLSPDTVAKMREIFKAQVIESGKPEAIAEKIVEGKLAKWRKEVVLVEQPFVKDTERSVDQVQKELSAKIKEKITIRRFVRFEVGEGLEKRENDFASEVAKQAQS